MFALVGRAPRAPTGDYMDDKSFRSEWITSGSGKVHLAAWGEEIYTKVGKVKILIIWAPSDVRVAEGDR